MAAPGWLCSLQWEKNDYFCLGTSLMTAGYVRWQNVHKRLVRVLLQSWIQFTCVRCQEMAVWFKTVPWGYFCRQQREAGTFWEWFLLSRASSAGAYFFPLTLQGVQPCFEWMSKVQITSAGSRNPTHSAQYNVALLLVSPSEQRRNRNHCTQNHNIEMHAVLLLSIWFLWGFL